MLRRNLQQLPAEPTTESNTATFSTVISPKKKVFRVYVFFSTSSRIKLRLWEAATRGSPRPRRLQRRRSGVVFGKMWKMSKIFRGCVKDSGDGFKVSILSQQQRPGSAMELGNQRGETEPTLPHAMRREPEIKTETPRRSHRFINHGFPKRRKLNPAHRSLQPVCIPATPNETYLVIDTSSKNVPFFW